MRNCKPQASFLLWYLLWKICLLHLLTQNRMLQAKAGSADIGFAQKIRFILKWCLEFSKKWWNPHFENKIALGICKQLRLTWVMAFECHTQKNFILRTNEKHISKHASASRWSQTKYPIFHLDVCWIFSDRKHSWWSLTHLNFSKASFSFNRKWFSLCLLAFAL